MSVLDDITEGFATKKYSILEVDRNVLSAGFRTIVLSNISYMQTLKID